MDMSSFEHYKVSVLVPVYNVEQYIGKCARSIFGQTYQNMEIIFVDDCSPDNSVGVVRQILEEFPNRKKQVKFIKHGCNRGIAATRNTLIEAATGDFIVFVDSDDWMEPDMVEVLVVKQGETGADIVSSNTFENDNTLNPHFINPKFNCKEDVMDFFVCLNGHHELWSRLYRRSLFVANGVRCVEGDNVSEDLFVTTCLFWYARSVAWVNRCLYHYVINHESLTHSKRTIAKEIKIAKEAYGNIRSLMDFLKNKDQGLYAKARLSALKYCYGIMYPSLDGEPETWKKWRADLLSTFTMPELRRVLGGKIATIIHLPFSYHVMRVYFKLANL